MPLNVPLYGTIFSRLFSPIIFTMRITYEGMGKGNSIVGGDSMAKEHAHFLAENTQKRHKGIEVQHALGNSLNHMGYEITADASLIDTR